MATTEEVKQLTAEELLNGIEAKGEFECGADLMSYYREEQIIEAMEQYAKLKLSPLKDLVTGLLANLAKETEMSGKYSTYIQFMGEVQKIANS